MSSTSVQVLSRIERHWITALALAAGGVAATSVVGQWLGDVRFKEASTDGWMAPTASWSVLILSVITGLLPVRGDRRWYRRLSAGGLGLVALANVAFGLRSALNADSSWNGEALLTSKAAVAAGFRVMNVSPIAAAALVLLSAVLGALVFGPANRAWRQVGLATAIVVTGFCALAALSRHFGLPPVLIPAKMQIAFWTAGTVAALGLALGIACGVRGIIHRAIFGRESEEAVASGAERRMQHLMLWGFVLAMALLCAIGYLYLRLNTAARAREAAAQLTSVADLKVSQIAAWRTERLGDARLLMRAPHIVSALRTLSDGTADGSTFARLREYLEEFRRTYGYETLALLDDRLAPQLVLPAAEAPAEIGQPAALHDLTRARDVWIEDLYRTRAGEIRLDFISPVREPDQGTFLGAVLLRVNARTQLFPIVQRWPTPSASGESFLIRRDDRAITYLNDLRFQPDSALNLQLPLDQPNLVGVRAMNGEAFSLTEGLDYRGVPVVGVARKVQDSPWTIVSKLDRQEAYGHATKDARLVTAIVGLIALLIWLSAAIYWRQRQRDVERRQHEIELERRNAVERLGQVLRHANDLILVFDDRMRCVEFNDRALAAYGYPAEELRAMTLRELRAPEAAANLPADFAKALDDAGFRFETVHRRKDGTTFPVEVNARPLEINGRRHVLSVARDVTDRKAYEHEIERLNRMYRVISQVNQAIVHQRERSLLFQEICRVLVEEGKFKIAWIGWHDAATRRIAPVAVAGDDTGYVDTLAISADPGVPGGRGPSAVAFREGRHYVCNDFFGDPVTLPYRERAARCGFRASMALPLRQDGRTVGQLAVYADEKDFFGPREITLLEEAADDVSFALDILAGEERRRKTEHALRESESRLNVLLTSTPAVIYSLRASGDFGTTFLSANVRDVLGYEPDVFMADSGFWLAHLHPDDVRATVSSFAKLSGQDTIAREYRFRHCDGTYRWMHDEMRLARDAAGQPIEFVGFWLDITTRKEAEAALRASELRHRMLFENMDLGAIYLDANGGVIAANPAAARILGVRPGETRQFPGLDNGARAIREDGSPIPPEAMPPLVALRTGQRVSGVVMGFKTADRPTRRWILLDAVPESQPGAERPDRVFTIFADITERLRNEAELRKLSRAIEQNPISMLITDLTGKIEYVNPRFTEVTGYTAEEVLGRNPRMFKSGLNPGSVYRDLWQTVTRGEVWRGELTNRKKDGSLHTELVVITPVNDAQGLPTHYVALRDDTTERKRMLTALQESEERYRLIADHSSDMIWLCDLATLRFTYVSPSVKRLRGFEPAELIGQPITNFATPRATEQTRRELPARIAAFNAGDQTARHRTYELELLCKDGSVVQTEVSTSLMADASGRAVTMLGVTRDISARRRAESNLRKLSRAVEQAPVSIAITDVSGAIEYVNPHFTSVTGYTLEEVRGQNPRVLKSGLTPPTVYTEMWATLTSGRVWRGELDNKKKNGEHYVELAVIAPVVDDDGQVTHYVAIKDDITEEKRTALALHESQERYRLIAEYTSDVIWIWDVPTGRFTYVSPSVEARMGYRAAEFAGLKMDDLLTPESARRIRRWLPRWIAAANSGRSRSRTMTTQVDHVARDGRIVASEAVTSLITDGSGQVVQLLGVSRDITERKKAREALLRFNSELEAKVAQRTSELAARNREMQALLQAIPDLVMQLRIDGTVAFWRRAKGSPELATITPGPDASAAEDTPPASLIDAVMPCGQRAMAENDLVTSDAEITEGGASVSVEVRAAPIGTGEYVAFVRDITARKRLQAETVAMLERERQLSEMKTRFISVTSHEFRTPMAAAVGSVELLSHHLDRLTPEKRRDLLHRITSSLWRMSEMLDDILTLNRMDENRTQLRLSSMRLGSFVSSVVEEIRLADRQAHRFEIKAPAGDALAFVTDPHLLHHILSNLLSNAVRYSPVGTLVRIDLHADAWKMQIAISDEGIGIPPADRARIFEPFERGSNVGNINGTGLGLNIVKRMTQLLSGSIEVTDAPGGGSRFTVTLPHHELPPPTS